MKTLILRSLFFVAAGAFIATTASHAALVAHYKMDETSGGTAFDSVGSSDAVPEQGAVTWGGGHIGGAGIFDGSASLKAPNAVPSGTSGFSMSMWFQPTGLSRDRGGIVNSRDDENWGFFREFMQFDGRIDNTPQGSGGSQGINSADVIAAGDLDTTWYHLALTWEDSGTGKVYLDGVNYGMTTTGATTFATPLSWYFGDDPCCGSREVRGKIDDVAFFDTTLSDAAIQALYVGGNQGLDASQVIPEPSAFVLCLFGLAAVGARGRRV